jgi:hypothetical protein
MSTESRGPHRMRASDAEREQYAHMVRMAMSEGRLTLEEGEERLGRVYAAKYRDELSPIVADLPDDGRQGPHESAEGRAAFRKGARHRVAIAMIVTIGLVGLWALSGAHFFWPLIPLLLLWSGVLHRLAGRCRRGWPGPGGDSGPGPGRSHGPGWSHDPGRSHGPGWSHGGPPPWAPGRT